MSPLSSRIGVADRALCEQLERKAAAWDSLQALCGYYQNGSETTVTLAQDDATRSCWIKVGTESKFHRKPRSYYAGSFEGAVQAAIAAGEGEE